MSGRHLLLLLPLLPPSSLAVYADPSPVSRTLQVRAVITNGYASDTAISDNTYGLGTPSLGILGNLVSPVNVASSSGAGSIIPTCTPRIAVSIVPNYGVNGGSSSQRYLKWVNGNEALAYQFYQDAAYSQVWGNGALARTIASFPASTQTYTIYVRLSAVGSLPPTGNCRDTVTITLSF